MNLKINIFGDSQRTRINISVDFINVAIGLSY